jgi:3-oxoacyl-[acyl-carrier protein] reductase
MSPADLVGKTALVTGASRGIGASVARLLAARGADVVLNYHSKRARAEKIADEIRAAGRSALIVQADLTQDSDVRAMIHGVRTEFEHLDILILNASGGLEKDKPPDYPMQLNLHAQVRLVDAALPLIPSGGRIIFVTSHLAHFHGERAVQGAYEVVAASKHAGEQALRGRSSEFGALGIGFVVVSGDMIEGTITPKLLERLSKGTIAARRREAGTLPTVDEFANAIANAASGELPREPVFVGSIE